MKKQWKRLLALLMVLTMCVAVLPGAALAADDEESGDDSSATTVSSKTLTVDASAEEEVEGKTYTTIQAAIDYIYALDATTDTTAKEDWTITVNAGTYNQFAVMPGLDGLTVRAASGETVTVNTWTGADNASARALYPSGAEFKDSFNSILICANDVTIDGLSIVVGNTGITSDGSGTESAPWYASGISDLGTNYIPSYRNEYDNVTVKNCSFTTSVGACSGVLYGCKENWTVNNCTFAGFTIAVYLLGDGYVAGTVNITNNVFTNCEQAVYAYYGGTPDEGESGTVTFSGNYMMGTASKYCMATFVDVYGNNGSIGTVVIKDNYLMYSIIGLVDVDGESIDIFGTNTCDNYSFYVWTEGDGGIDKVNGETFEYHYVSSGSGYWTVSEEDLYTMKNYLFGDVEDILETLQTAADEAGNSNLLPVEVTLVNYSKTFLEPGCIYWVPSEKTSEPGLEKKILIGDGEDVTEVDQTSASTDDTIKFQLTSNVPKGLDTYDEYILTFHDVLDSALSLNEDSFTVTIGGEEITDYTLTISTEDEPLEDSCTFELSIELKDIEGIKEGDEIVVTYTADLTTKEPGAYYNEAWVTYPDDESEHDKVEVDTYGISVFKYDASSYTTGDNGTITYAALSGAVFTLYSDEDCTVKVGTDTSDENGTLTFSGLAEGTYYLVETEAPSGYVGSSTVIEIVIPDDANADTFWAYASVPNAPVPETGGTGTAMYTTVGVIILLAAGCVFLFTRKKRESD